MIPSYQSGQAAENPGIEQMINFFFKADETITSEAEDGHE